MMRTVVENYDAQSSTVRFYPNIHRYKSELVYEQLAFVSCLML